MRRAVYLLGLALLGALLTAASALAEGRFALIVGNGAYEGAASLANPSNDARAIAEKLEGLGFETMVLLDATGAETIGTFSQFNRQIQRADLAVFYFAGHGVQVGADSFLLPTDVDVNSEESLRFTAIDAGWVVREMEKRAEVSLIILDACRDNPFPDMLESGTRSASVSRGLGIIPLSGKGAIIAYAAAAGRVADDGEGGHSPYTQALLEEIDAVGVEVGLMLRRVAGRVIAQTDGVQRPELLVRLIDEVYLNPLPPGYAPAFSVASAPEPADAVEPDQPAAEPIRVAEAAQAPPNGRSTSTKLFGDRPIKPPSWFKGLVVPEPSGWASDPPVSILDDEPASGFEGARPLPLAALVKTWIVARGQSAWYRVDVPVAGELTVTIDEPPEELDLHARIHNADHAVTANWQGPTGVGAPLDGAFALPGPGRYWIEIKDGRDDAASETAFDVAIDFRPADDPLEPNPSIATAAPVNRAINLTPTIFPRGDIDWLTFWVDSPGLFTAEATNVPENLDIAMRVNNFNGDVIRNWAQPARIGGETLLDAEIAAPGQYYLEIKDSRDDASSVNPFDLALDFQPIDDVMEPNNSFGTASLQPASKTHRIAVFPRGDVDWIALDVTHPGELSVSITSVPENLDVYFRVWNAEKDVTTDWVGPPRPGGDTVGFADLPKPGRYFVQVKDGRDDASSAASFDLSMVFVEQPDQFEPNDSFADARPLTPGGEILFNILPRGDHDRFRITVDTAGELTAVIDPSPENLDLHYRVYDANRTVIKNWVAPYRMGGVTEGFVDLPAAGTYFLEIVDGRDDARAIEHAVLKTAFRATPDPLEPNNSFGDAKPLVLGQPHRGYILPRGDTDWYLLDLARAGMLNVEIDEVDPELDLAFRVWNEAGRDITGWFMPSRKGAPVFGDVPISAPGQYRIEVVDSRSDARAAAGYLLSTEMK